MRKSFTEKSQLKKIEYPQTKEKERKITDNSVKSNQRRIPHFHTLEARKKNPDLQHNSHFFFDDFGPQVSTFTTQ